MFASFRLSVALGIVLAAPLLAYERNDQVAVIAEPRTKPDTDGVSFPYGMVKRIFAVEGDRLRVGWGDHLIGSVAADEVIPIDDALAYFNKRIEAKPTANNYTARGRVYSATERPAEAGPDFDAALKLDADNVPALIGRSENRCNLQDFPGSMADAEKAIRLAPSDPEVVFALAAALGRSNRTRESIEAYQRLIRLQPDNYAARNNLAKNYIDYGRDAEAFALLNEAIRIFPEYSDAYTNRGIVYHRRKELDRAIEDATSAIKFNEKNPSAWNNRGNAYLELKRYDDAVRDFRELIKLDPKRPEGHYGLSNTFYLADKHDDAIKEIDIVIELNSHDYKAQNTRANILKKTGRHKEAVAAFNEAVTTLLREAATHAWLQRSAVERVVEGETLLPREVVQFPERRTLATILGNRADAHRLLGDKKELYADLTRAITLNPENFIYRQARAQQHFNDGDYGRATDDFSAVLEVAPTNTDALWGRVLAATQLNRMDEARRDAKRLLELGYKIDQETLKKLGMEQP